MKKVFKEEFFFNGTVKTINLLDHDAVGIVIEKSSFDFHINL